MDELVKQAMAKWPNVPDCYGWLGLDGRGDWYMRDDQVQAVGNFAMSKGSRLEHEKLIEFIGRNYEADAQGCWYFQNGPQRVYVELMHTPWIWRVHADGSVTSHTELTAQVKCAYNDEHGRVYLLTTLGFGLVHTQDVHWAATEIEQGRWTLRDVLEAELPTRFGFVKSPQQMRDEKKPA